MTQTDYAYDSKGSLPKMKRGEARAFFRSVSALVAVNDDTKILEEVVDHIRDVAGTDQSHFEELDTTRSILPRAYVKKYKELQAHSVYSEMDQTTSSGALSAKAKKLREQLDKADKHLYAMLFPKCQIESMRDIWSESPEKRGITLLGLLCESTAVTREMEEDMLRMEIDKCHIGATHVGQFTEKVTKAIAKYNEGIPDGSKIRGRQAVQKYTLGLTQMGRGDVAQALKAQPKTKRSMVLAVRAARSAANTLGHPWMPPKSRSNNNRRGGNRKKGGNQNEDDKGTSDAQVNAGEAVCAKCRKSDCPGAKNSNDCENGWLCYNCQKNGHKANECPDPKTERTKRKEAEKAAKTAAAAETVCDDSCLKEKTSHVAPRRK